MEYPPDIGSASSNGLSNVINLFTLGFLNFSDSLNQYPVFLISLWGTPDSCFKFLLLGVIIEILKILIVGTYFKVSFALLLVDMIQWIKHPRDCPPLLLFWCCNVFFLLMMLFYFILRFLSIVFLLFFLYRLFFRIFIQHIL